MVRKLSLSLFIAAALMVLLTAAVGAQDAPEGPVGLSVAGIEPLTATITQSVPLTLTVNISGPGGIQALTVPFVLNLDIRLAFTDGLTASVAATATAATTVEAVITAEEIEPPARVTPTEPAPTAIPTRPAPAATATPAPPTPRPLAPTATPAPADKAEATATATATADAEVVLTPTVAAPSVAPPACEDTRAVNFAPRANEVISGTVDVYGTAQHDLFQYYKLEYAQGSNVDPTGEFAYITGVSQPVVDGLLATLDTTSLDNGPYTLRLTVVDRTGNFPPPCTVTVQIAN